MYLVVWYTQFVMHFFQHGQFPVFHLGFIHYALRYNNVKVIHVHHDLRKMFITLVWND